MIAEVIVDILNSNVDKIFDYQISEGQGILIGQQVKVPFGNRTIEGFVINIKNTTDLDGSKLKSIIGAINSQPMLSQVMVKLCFFMKDRFFIRLADAIRLFLPPQVRTRSVKEKIVQFISLTDLYSLAKLNKNAKAQIGAILYLEEKAYENITVLNKKFGSAAIKKLLQLGFIAINEEQHKRKPNSGFTVEKKEIVLTDQQNAAIKTIISGGANTTLLHGVTGSGKTEVYMAAITEALKKGKTAIFLVPEISLTPQMLSRFKNTFGETVAVLHSSLSAGQRYDEWYRLKNGEAKIAIGARSCIFAPLNNVGIIVIDEEYDGSYFSESNPRYFTHDVAKYLAHLHGATLVLGSATPSIDSFYKAKQGEYRLLSLPNRVNNKNLPAIQIIDMLSEIRKGNTGIFSISLLTELENCIKNNKQAMLFINRRGYSSFMMCKECGYVAKCTDCDVSLVFHKEDDELKCHYCNKRYRALTQCPECKSKYIRQGAVGTQRIVEELRKIFPNVPLLRLDNDTTKNKDSYINILEQFNNTTPAILVGTQMIAKGHDFNNVTLVGIIDADLSLNFSDFRATERTFQLITQVSGRAGRSEFEGKVILQTYYPRHFVYRYVSNYDYEAFFKKEINLRETTKFPPFSKILRVLVLNEKEDKAIASAKNIFDRLNELKECYKSDFIYLQAMKCPKKRLQNKYRYQILTRIYTKNEKEIIAKIFEICENININNTSVFVESNPQNLS